MSAIPEFQLASFERSSVGGAFPGLQERPHLAAQCGPACGLEEECPPDGDFMTGLVCSVVLGTAFWALVGTAIYLI